MKNNMLFILLILISTKVFSQDLPPKEKAVFDEIAYHRIKIGEYEKIHKWVIPIYYKIVGDSSKYIVEEIDSTFSQLRKLTKLDIRKSNDDDEVNFVINLSSNGEMPPSLSSILKKYMDSYGGYTYRANKNSELYRMESLFVLSKYSNKADVRHAVKKGIIRGMGFFKRSKNAPNSLFYNAGNRKLKLDDFDSAIIAAFYGEKIKAGMTKDEVDEVFK